jgi:adenylosuccinate synthase
MTGNTVDTQLALLNREILSHDTIIKTLSGTMHEIGKVTNSIERMLMLHEQRISTSDKDLSDIRHDMQKQKEDTHKEVSKIYEHIEEKNEQLAQMLTSFETRISKSISDVSQALHSQNEKIDQRVTLLERWRYVILGAGVVLGFILNFVASNIGLIATTLTK